MFRTALVALSPVHSNEVLLDYAWRLAAKHRLRLAGLAVVDRDRVSPREAVPIGGATFKVRRDEASVETAREGMKHVLQEFVRGCREQGIAHLEISGEDDVAHEIARESPVFDLVLLGYTDDRVREATPLFDILKACPRPVVVVPDIAPPEGPVVIAYDGSLQASRALREFITAGLWRDAALHVACFHEDASQAEQNASIAVKFLGFHDLRAQVHAGPLKDRPETLIADVVKSTGAAMLVMGAYGKSAFRDFFLGSVTKRMLERADVPVFLFH
jgi:nucleotide-binding universal stress UspA family protein